MTFIDKTRLRALSASQSLHYVIFFNAMHYTTPRAINCKPDDGLQILYMASCQCVTYL